MDIKKIVLALLLVAIGFFIGRKTSITESIKYVKGETVIDSVDVPYPIFVEVPKYPELPMLSDTVYLDSIQVIYEKVDTAKIISDYTLRRTYSFNLFDDKTGKLDVMPVVQYNQLRDLTYSWTPITKVVSKAIRRKYTPFVSGGYSTNGYVVYGGGLYINDLGLEYNYNRRIYNSGLIDHGKDYHTIKLKYKF